MSSASIVNNIALQFNRFVPIPIFILGFFGNIFNILIFIRPSLIKNPCSIYFLSSSITNLNVLFFGLVTRWLSDGFRIDLVSNNFGYCRFRYFILHCSLVLSSWFTILAGIDRYCVSSRNVQRRRLSNLKYARYLVVLATSIVAVSYSHALGLFTIEQLKTGPYCYAQAGTYRIFYDFFYFATYSFTPPIMMIIVGLATLHNIHQSRSNITPLTITNTTNVNQLRKRDRQLIKMLLIQIIFTVVLTSPIAVQKLYTTFTQNVIKDAYQIAIESLITQILRMCSFINSSTSFFVFTLSGSVYRKEFSQIIGKMIGFVFGKNSSLYRKFQVFTEIKTTVQSIHAQQTMTIIE